MNFYPPTFDPQKVIGLTIRDALPDLGLRIEDLHPAGEPPGKLAALSFGRWHDDSAPWGCIYLRYIIGRIFSVKGDWSIDTILSSEITGIRIMNGKTILSAGGGNELACLVK